MAGKIEAGAFTVSCKAILLCWKSQETGNSNAKLSMKSFFLRNRNEYSVLLWMQ